MIIPISRDRQAEFDLAMHIEVRGRAIPHAGARAQMDLPRPTSSGMSSSMASGAKGLGLAAAQLTVLVGDTFAAARRPRFTLRTTSGSVAISPPHRASGPRLAPPGRPWIRP